MNDNFDHISILEYQTKKLSVFKAKYKETKPFKFQKKKMKKYDETIKKVDLKLDEYNNLLLEEYLKLEQKK